MDQKKYFAAFISILALNIFLKFYGIGENSIWLDEAYSVNEAKYSSGLIITHSTQSDNPPVYYLLLHGWTEMFGNSEAGMRSLSAISSIVAACLLFVFVVRIVSLEAGFISSLLFTLSNQNIYYAQETRTYALVTMLTVLSIGFYLLMYKKYRTGFFLGLTISNLLLIYSHYLSICIPIIECGLALIYFKENPDFTKKNLISLALVFLAFLPWAHVPLSNKPKDTVFWLAKPNFANIKGVFIEIANNKLMLVSAAIIVLVYLFTLYRKNRSFKNVLSFINVALITFYILPVIILYFISNYTPVFLLRYLLFISVPFYMLTGISLYNISQNKNVRYGIAIILVAFSLITLQLHPVKQEDWKGAVAYMKSIRKDNQPVILSASYTHNAFTYYYDRNLFMLDDSMRIQKLYEDKIYVKGKTSGEEVRKISGGQPVIAVLSHDSDQDPENTLVNNLSEMFSSAETKSFGKVRVLQFK
jgi:uncharacterized membrane protein